MSIQITTAKRKIEFSKMVKDYKIRYYNLGPNVLYVDYVDSTGTKIESVPAYGSFTIASNAGNAANSYLNFYTSSGTTNIVVSKIQQDCTVDGTDLFGNLVTEVDPADIASLLQKTANMTASSGVTTFTGTVNVANFVSSGSVSVGSVELTEESLIDTQNRQNETETNVSNLQQSVTDIDSKIQNQSATSGNTSFTGNLSVSGTISTVSMSDIASNVSQNQSAISSIQTDVSTLALSKLSAGALYFNSGKLSGSNFAVPTFPFSICATVQIDAWKDATEMAQTIFQYGNYGSGTGALCAIAFSDGKNNPRLRLKIADTIDGAQKTTEIMCAVNLSEFLGKMHTIVGICRAVTADEALNWDIYIDGAKQNITSSSKDAIVSSLSGARAWAVNTSNFNFSSQPASANPMMLRNLYIFNFDISAEGSPYGIADYEAGRLIPPALKPSQVSLALENYTIARNATTALVKDASGNFNDATVQVLENGTVAGDNDQSIKVFVDEIKTQINQSNG